MPIVLDTTVGGVSSNAYLSLAEADTYHDSRLFVTSWTSATDAVKNAAITWATRMLDDGVIWHNIIKDITTPQALGWPRSGMIDGEFRTILDNVIPIPVKDATAELARLLIESDRAADVATVGFDSIEVGPIKLSIDKLDVLSVIPDAVYSLIRSFGIRTQRKGTALLVRT